MHVLNFTKLWKCKTEAEKTACLCNTYKPDATGPSAMCIPWDWYSDKADKVTWFVHTLNMNRQQNHQTSYHIRLCNTGRRFTLEDIISLERKAALSRFLGHAEMYNPSRDVFAFLWPLYISWTECQSWFWYIAFQSNFHGDDFSFLELVFTGVLAEKPKSSELEQWSSIFFVV